MATRGAKKGERKQQETPFYALPDKFRASSQIIDEARRSLHSVPIKRPFTPAPDGRHLFGNKGNVTDRPSRPPSAFSMTAGRYYNEEGTSRPSSKQRLSPIMNEDLFVPPTPAQSSADVNLQVSLPPTPPLSASHSTEPSLPELKTSTSSPTMSRSRSEESERGYNSGYILKQSNTSTHTLTNGVTIGAKAADKKNKEAAIINQQTTSSNGETSKEDKDSVSIAVTVTNAVTSQNSSEVSMSRSQTGQIWERELKPLLDQLNPAEASTDTLITTCNDIWKLLETHSLLGKGLGGKRRSVLLKAVFGLLGHKEPELLLKLAKITLAMQVKGSNLLNASKVVFSLSREETNDSLFLKEDIITHILSVLSTADPETQYDTLVYISGSIKLLASNPQLRDKLIDSECIKAVADCLKKCTEVNSSGDVASNNKIANVLVQLIAGLRNISDSASAYDQFLIHSVPQSLSLILQQHISNAELVFNLSRLLSKLSLVHKCCKVIGDTNLYVSLLPVVLTTHAKHEDIVLRVCFILSNISDDIHALIHTQSLLESLELILTQYTQCIGGGGGETNNAKSIDVLIKSVSLLGNLSVHSNIAIEANKNETIIIQLIHILEMFPGSSEELTVNTLTALNNLSFYSQETMLHHKDRIMKIILQFLGPDRYSVMLESVRVLGNLTRDQSFRSILSQMRVDEVLLTLLDSKHIELVYAVCGVLVNITMDAGEHLNTFRTNDGVKKLLDALSHFGKQDWLLSSLTCKVLWNYSKGMSNMRECFTDEERLTMYHLLEEYLDPATAFFNCMEEEEEGDMEGQTNDESERLWTSDFVPVASKILTKLQQCSVT